MPREFRWHSLFVEDVVPPLPFIEVSLAVLAIFLVHLSCQPASNTNVTFSQARRKSEIQQQKLAQVESFIGKSISVQNDPSCSFKLTPRARVK